MNSATNPEGDLYDLLTGLLAGSDDTLDGIDPADFSSWWKSLQPRLAGKPSSFGRALVAGYHSDRLGYAFAGGYQGAIQGMLPDFRPGDLGAVCITEAGGGHPRAIESKLESGGEGRFSLSGRKQFVTLGLDARVLLVAAVRAVREDGRKDIALVRVAADAPGVKPVEMEPLPFVPEIGHAAVELTDVAVAAADLLPGDGYESYIKPFRTYEDIHVHASLLGYLLGVARRYGWNDEVKGRLAALVCGLHAIWSGNATSAPVHIALGGFLGISADVIGGLEKLWSDVDEDEAARWERDRALLGVAGKARAQRFITAWQKVRSR